MNFEFNDAINYLFLQVKINSGLVQASHRFACLY